MNKFNDIWVFMDETDKASNRISIELLSKAQELANEAGMNAVPVYLPAGIFFKRSNRIPFNIAMCHMHTPIISYWRCF